MSVHSFKDIADNKKHNEAREIREALFGQSRSILEQLGDDVSGFALVVWDRRGDLRSSYDTGHGPLRPALVPTLASDALNRHVALDLAAPTDETGRS
jgi:hypothetical protein